MEARQVHAAFRMAFPREAPRLLSGKADRPALLREMAEHRGGKHWRYLHLATHGFFDPRQRGMPLEVLAGWTVGTGAAGRTGPLGALIPLLAADEPGMLDRSSRRLDLTGQSYRVFDRNPLLLAGLVLAAANHSEEDGLLSAEEVAGLDLRGCELAVLSACQTGEGKLGGWQGVQGLQRGFHAAGARAVVASLWNVSDPATSVLMEVFYHNLWVKKLPRLQALRQAQLIVLKEPSRVEKRSQELAALLRKKGLGKQMLAARGIEDESEAAVKPAAAAKGQRSPVAWWAPWVLSGDPGP
jgi:CHAT domain-containing protein